MRMLKYLGLVVALFLAVVLPVRGVSADTGTQVRIMPRTVLEHGDGIEEWKGPVKPQQFTSLTGRLRSPEDGAKRYAIVIGSNYESLPEDAVIPPFVPPFSTRLNWAVNDAYAMAGLLAGFDEVITLVGSGPDGANRANILNAIQKMERQVEEDDEVVFYYSGHGAQQLRSEQGEGWGAASEGIVTDEGSKVDFIWDKDLAKAFRDFESERMVFIFDACLTGGMTELAGEDRLVLMATGKDGIAVEDAGPDDPNNLGIGQGFFTFFLMAALTGNAPQVDVMLSSILGVDIQNPYAPVPGAPVSVEQAFDYASWSLLAVSPLVYGGLAYYFGPEIAAYWDTPTVIDRFRGDLLL